MRYILKKALPGFKVGELIHECSDDEKYPILRMERFINDYPDFFEPISEEDEKDQEAVKWLKSRGYKVTKPGEEFPNNYSISGGLGSSGYGTFTCSKCGITYKPSVIKHYC